MIYLDDFAGQNWTITPVATAAGAKPPVQLHDQIWQVVLSGVVVANFKGNSTSQWLQDTVSFKPDMAGPGDLGTSGPLAWAVQNWGIPKPAGTTSGYTLGFALQQWAPFASLSSVYDQEQSINAGFAVNTWRPAPFSTGTDLITGQPVSQLFTGINVDVAASDSDAIIYRLGYQIQLVGKIVFMSVPIIE
jgi:hypothetical protein